MNAFVISGIFSKYEIVIEDVNCIAVSSADMSTVSPLTEIAEDLIKMDKISLKTLQDCMQSVFEDGPKRDRRLWIGDLRLQAQANYYTFKNYDLVKRCLYLFGGLAQNEGRVGACLFIEPKLLVDDTVLYDYSLFFISCLYDYYEETKDLTVLKDLWEVAYRQAELALDRVDENGVVRDSDDWWCFLDWHDELNDDFIIPDWDSVLIVPVVKKESVKGILYITVPLKEKEFNQEILNVINVFANIFSGNF